jgi:hypothetical protein
VEMKGITSVDNSMKNNLTSRDLRKNSNEMESVMDVYPEWN